MQHLLGIGHLVRGSRVAKAAAAGGFDVTVVVGGDLPEGLDFGGSAIRQLPPVKAGPGGFGDLVTPEGLPFDDARRVARRDLLLQLFTTLQPDILLIEAFPFGRRPMRFELTPLLEAARTRPDPPLILASIRDILQQSQKPGRDVQTVDCVRAAFDGVIVHGDPTFCPLERSFPLATTIADRLLYSGLVGPAVQEEPGSSETFEVIVSVGGGAVGARLIETALAARPLSRLSDASWLVLTGPNRPLESAPRGAPGVTLRAFAPDLPARLTRARLSISQAGYNTVADLFRAPACRAVLVPHTAGGETEQGQRGAIMAERGWAVVADGESLTPGILARAIDRALDLPQRAVPVRLDGAERSCDLLWQALRAKRDTGSRPDPS